MPERALDILQRCEGKLGTARKSLLATFHDSLARCYASLDQHSRSLEHWKKAMTLEPSNDCYVANYGLKLRQCGNPHEAIAYLRRAIDLAPDDGVNYCLLAQALRETGDENGAQAELKEGRMHLERELRRSPRSTYLLAWYSTALHGLGEYAAAKKQRTLVKDISRSDDIQANLGELVGGSDSGIFSDEELDLDED